MRPFHRNVSFATVENFRQLLANSAYVTVRGEETREVRNQVTVLTAPKERCLFLPGRNHDIFAHVAETMWVLAGRDDVPWLQRYLDRAPLFSDDGGQTWRGAYGPRLRRWPGGVDQLDEWRRLLLSDSLTRRATGVLFDPARDFLPTSKDIPCNNWLSWLQRDGRLNLSIAVRSNDATWGFSGINAFEWSVLQEMLAFWVGAEVGDATFFATSYHVYKRHYATAARIVSGFYGLTPYAYGISSPPFATQWDTFPSRLESWFCAERVLSENPDAPVKGMAEDDDPLLFGMLQLLRLKWGSTTWDVSRLTRELAAMPETDFAVAAYEHFARKIPALLDDIPQPRIADFFGAWRSARSADSDGIKPSIKLLHARKNASYAGAWKRRGERVSILPNIARKVDRLEAFSKGASALEGETVLDTAIDLVVYSIKYVLFLAEHEGASISAIPAMNRRPFSDFDENFDALLDSLPMGSEPSDMMALIRELPPDFEQLCKDVDAGLDLHERQRRVAAFMTRSLALVLAVTAAFPEQAQAFFRAEAMLQRR